VHLRPFVPFVAGVFLAAIPQVALACSILKPVSNTDMVRDAEIIVRARALEYTRPPADPTAWTAGVPDSRVRFKIVEVIRGARLPTVELPGYLSDLDDFNDHSPPYTFVRPGGRAGSCFANTYRAGAEFLLLMKSAPAGGYTVNWYALGPVNEQLHSDQDPWLVWVRKESAKSRQPNHEMEPTRRLSSAIPSPRRAAHFER
jgi:hypothetical protein